MPLDKNKNNTNGPLSGKLVIDASQGIAGPYCAQMLASYGARVIKIDPPGGDWCRSVGTTFGTLSYYAVAYNRGKEGIVLDLKQQGDLETLYDLVAEADIFLESSRPGVAQKIGIDFDTLTEKNSSLIYLSISGFGQQGPYSKRPCTDGVAQAYSGLVNGNVGEDGLPHKLDIPIVDIVTGLMACQSISMALLQRDRDGKAQYLDNSLVASALEVQKVKLIEQHLNGNVVAKLNVPSGIYAAKDANVAIALATHAHFLKLMGLLNAENVVEDMKLDSFEACMREEEPLRAKLREIIAQETADHWMDLLGGAGIIVNRINSLEDVLQDKKAKEGGLLQDVSHAGLSDFLLPKLPLTLSDVGDAPEKGQDTEAVLAELRG